MDDAVVETLPPAEAFALVGHETRFAILEALTAADGPVPFSTLYDRVDVRDSGQFNYHLGKLDGRFVTDENREGADEDEDGYRLTPAGRRVVGAVLSGGLTKELDADPVPLDSACAQCGAPLAVEFDASRVVVACDECGLNVVNVAVPPGALEDYGRDEIPGAVDRWLTQFVSTLTSGFCPSCEGRLDRRVLTERDEEAPDWVAERDYGAIVVDECRRCRDDWVTSVASTLLEHPAVVAFYHDHGVDLRDVPIWEIDEVLTATPTVASEDPLRVDVPISLDEETLVLTVDESVEVVEERRS